MQWDHICTCQTLSKNNVAHALVSQITKSLAQVDRNMYTGAYVHEMLPSAYKNPILVSKTSLSNTFSFLTKRQLNVNPLSTKATRTRLLTVQN